MSSDFQTRKRAAGNEQFATSGGATRPSGSAEQCFLALVRAFAIPPPAASCHHVTCKRGKRSAFRKRKRQSVVDSYSETRQNE